MYTKKLLRIIISFLVISVSAISTNTTVSIFQSYNTFYNYFFMKHNKFFTPERFLVALLTLTAHQML